MIKGRLIAVGILLIGLSLRPTRAADHADGPRASADPAADITDVFAWTSPDARRVNLVMDLVRNATSASRFSDGVQYAFHTTSRAGFGAQPSEEVDVVCVFNRAQRIRCWVGQDEHARAQVAGHAGRSQGISSPDGRLRVFAGLREDPFFFNLAGFRETARIVTGAAPGLTFDPAGCPALDGATSAALVNQLVENAPAEKAGLKTLDIIVGVDGKDTETPGDVVGAITGRKPGDTVSIDVLRDGKKRNFKLTLAERKTQDAGAESGAEEHKGSVKLGMRVAELTPQLRSHYEIPEGIKGVVILEVDPRSPASNENLQEGQIQQQPASGADSTGTTCALMLLGLVVIGVV